MSDEIQEQAEQVAVSEQPEVEAQEQNQDQRMVPLAALQAERKKRQELEARAEIYQKMIQAKEQEEPAEPEDPSALVEKRHLYENVALTKREILESVFQDAHPEAVQKINKYLDPILEKKPWLADSVKNAQNRYARAFEIVNDYLHLVETKPSAKVSSLPSDGQRIVQNSQKPRSPVEVGKSAQPGGIDYLKSIQGRKEFREYRQKLLRGEA